MAFGGFGGGTTVTTPATAVLATPRVSADGRGWDKCILGSYQLPPDLEDGVAIPVVSEDKLDIDEKKSQGKDKAKATIHGTGRIKIVVNVEVTEKSWPALESLLTAIDPNGPNKGVPFAWDNYRTRFRGVKSVIVTEIGDLVVKGGTIKVAIHLVEWTDPVAATVTGGATTPTQAKKYQANGADGGAYAAGLGAAAAAEGAAASAAEKALDPKKNPKAPNADP